jgi:hypothetical protein
MDNLMGAIMPILLTQKQVLNQKKEFLYAKRLSHDLKMYEFATGLYQRLLEKARPLELSAQNSSVLSPVMREFKSYALPKDLFTHSDTSYYAYTDLHGSVGEGNAMFFKNLPQKSNAYFDVVMTAITNSIFQYEGKGLISLVPRAKIPHDIEETRAFRSKSAISAPVVKDMALTHEERAVHGNEYDFYHTRGEHFFQLDPCPYTKRAAELNAPVITGMSGDTYEVYRFLALFLELDKNEFIQLRNLLIAYLVTSHDHSLIEVVDVINLILRDPDFARCFQFDVSECILPLETPEDYEHAFFSIFNVSPINSDTSSDLIIQKNCKNLIDNLPPKWLDECIALSISQWLSAIGTITPATLNNYDGLSPSQFDLLSEICSYNQSQTKAPGIYKLKLLQLKNETREQILALFKAIKQAEPAILHDVLLEEQHEWSLTALESIVALFCHAKFSPLPLKILGEGSRIRGLVYPTTTSEEAKSAQTMIQNFGFSTSALGVSFDSKALSERANVKGEFHVPDQTHGAILSALDYTPLLNIVWMMGAATSKQDIVLTRANLGIDQPQLFAPQELFDKETNRMTMLACELYVLSMFGYEAINIEDHGLLLTPREQTNKFDITQILSGLLELSQMKEEELINHINQILQPTTDRDLTNIVSPNPTL